MKEFRECWENRTDPRAFPRFLAKTKAFWNGLARSLQTRWQGPRAVELPDLEQELLLGAWSAFGTYDPTKLGREERSEDLFKYVAFVATREAKRWLHEQRGLPRRNGSDREAPNHDVLFEDVFGPGAELGVRGGTFSKEVELADKLLIREEEREEACRKQEELYWNLFYSVVSGHEDPVLGMLRKVAGNLVKDAGIRQLLRTDREGEVVKRLLEVLEDVRAEEVEQ